MCSTQPKATEMKRNPGKYVLEESRGREASGQWGLQSSLWVSGWSCWFWGNICHPCPSVRCLMLNFVCNSEGKAHPERRGEGTVGNPLFTLCASCSQELLGSPCPNLGYFGQPHHRIPFINFSSTITKIVLFYFIYIFFFFCHYCPGMKLCFGASSLMTTFEF